MGVSGKLSQEFLVYMRWLIAIAMPLSLTNSLRAHRALGADGSSEHKSSRVIEALGKFSRNIDKDNI